MVFNAIFNNISAISWQSVLLVEKTGVPGENPRPAASHWQTPGYNGYLQQRGITCHLYRKADLVKLCELAQDLQLEIVTSTNDYDQSHVTLFFLNFAFLFCPGNVKKNSTSLMYPDIFPTLPYIWFTLWNTASILWMLGSIHITMKNVLITITSNITN
jgi:hypothetical protein